MTHRLQSFIQQVLVNEIRDLNKKNYQPYFLFGLIAQGIEMLGACLDFKNIQRLDNGERRFRDAIHHLFPYQYHTYNDKGMYDLYFHLHNALIHAVAKDSLIKLVKLSEEFPQERHLTFDNSDEQRLIIILEELIEDFELACVTIIGKIERGEIDKTKFAEKIPATIPADQHTSYSS